MSSLIKEVHTLSNVIFSWDVGGNYSTKSTVAGCVKRLCLGSVDELLAAFEVSKNVLGIGAIADSHTSYNISLKND